MAGDSTTTNYNTVNDLPEYVKPYYQMLLNATSGLVFDPKYTASQLGSSANIPSVSQIPQPPVSQPPVDPSNPTTPTSSVPTTTQISSPGPPTPGAIPVSYRGGTNQPIGLNDIARAYMNSQVFQSGRGRACGGPIQMAGGGVPPILGGSAYNTGLGGVVSPGTPQTIPITYGGQSGLTYISPSGPVQPGSSIVTNPANPPPAYQTRGVTADPHIDPGYGVTPGSYYVGGTGPNSYYPSGQGPMGQGPSGQYPMGQQPTSAQPFNTNTSALQAAGMASPSNAHDILFQQGTSEPPGGGWNPLQYLGSAASTALAKQLGGQTESTQAATGPMSDPSQNYISYKGADMNAGLSQQMIDQFGADRAKQMFDAIAAQEASGPMTPNKGVDMSASNAAYHAASGGLLGIARRTATNPNRKHFDTGGQTPLGFGSNDPGSGNTPGSGASPTATSGWGNGVFTPFQPYQGQRVLSSDPNANQSQTWTVSPRTFQAESGLSSLPNTLNSDGSLAGSLGTAGDYMTWGMGNTGSIYGNLTNLANQYDLNNTPIKSNYQKASYTPSQFTANSVDPNSLQLGSAGQVQMDPLQLYQQTGPSQWTDQGMSSQYMSPYQQQVTDVQKGQAVRDFNETQQTRDAAAVRAGAYGGSREGVADAVANRDLQNQLAQIQATGSQNAYQNAQTQFNADRASAEAAKQNNLGAALQTQGLNTNAGLQAALANQSTAANQYGQLFGGQLQASLANQQAGLTAQQLAEQSKQFGANLGNSSNQFADTQGLAAQQLSAQLQQASLGQALQANQSNNQQAATYADLYRLGNQQQIQNLQQMQTAGAAEDARRQAGLNLGYQDYINSQNWPYQQANFYSGILRGVPTAVNSNGVQVSQQNYNPWAQTIGNLAGMTGMIGGSGSGGNGGGGIFGASGGAVSDLKPQAVVPFENSRFRGKGTFKTSKARG